MRKKLCGLFLQGWSMFVENVIMMVCCEGATEGEWHRMGDRKYVT